jgi:hypothetical protein
MATPIKSIMQVFLHLLQGLVAHPGVQWISKAFALGCTKLLHQLYKETNPSTTLQTQMNPQEGADMINQE